MTEADAFDLACHEPEIQEKILPLEFSYSFEKLKDFEAILEFRIADTEASREERRKRKKELKEEKRKRKEARKERLANLSANKVVQKK